MGQLDAASSAPLPQFFGHPRGLSTLFFAEMWERFSFYGLRSLMTLFMPLAIAKGGLGFSDARTGMVIAIYTSMAYLVNFPGGWIADKLLGLRRAVLCGGIIIMCGHICLAFHGVGYFFSGLALVVAGTGLLKPNMTSMVGQLYPPGDARRDAGFSLYYMGINIGALLAPLVCGTLAQSVRFREYLDRAGIDPQRSWHFGFGAAAVGMFFGLLQYVLGGRYLGEAGLRSATPPSPEERARVRKTVLAASIVLIAVVVPVVVGEILGWFEITVKGLNILLGVVLVVVPIAYFGFSLTRGTFSPEEKRRLGVVATLFVFSTIFFTGLEQGGGTMNLFGDRHVRHELFGREFPSLWLQFLNPFWVISLSPVFAWLWVRLGKRDPSSPAKFSIGLCISGITFMVMSYAARLSESGPVSPFWLVAVFLGIVLAELCISPVGLSMVTRLVPDRATGQIMGIWFVGNALANFLAGQSVVLTTRLTQARLFGMLAAVSLIASLVLAALVRPIRRLMAGVP